jgi:ribosomal protein L37AE/L43A
VKVRNSLSGTCPKCGGAAASWSDGDTWECEECRILLKDSPADLTAAEKTAWARRLTAVKDKHERTGGPDEQHLAELGRTS